MKSSRTINIKHLYAREMNVYGDNGNVVVLKSRLERRGYEVSVGQVNVDDTESFEGVDIIVGGGGQDSGQLKVEKDLQGRSKVLHDASNDGVAMLMICGMFQLFGRYFLTREENKVNGLGIFNLHTEGGQQRMIGNVLIDTEFGDLVGFENHSGKTILGEGQKALGKVIKGAGNNGISGKEGAVVDNTFGSYLHGPLFPKNPVFADELISRALERKYGKSDLEPLDDSLENAAFEHAKTLSY